MKAFIFVHWGDGTPLKGQPPQEREVLEIDGDVVTLEEPYAMDKRARFSLATGRKLAADGSDHPWDLWRLDTAKLRKGML